MATASIVPVTDIEEQAYAEPELAKFKDPVPGQVIVRNKGRAPAATIPGAEISATLLQSMQRLEESITAQSGVNPFASGDKVKGIQYATEVNAIQSQASLTASAIASDIARFWSTGVSLVLMLAKLYDYRPISLVYEGVRLEFGPEDPIGRYIRTDVMPSVTESTLGFESRDQKIQRATALAAQLTPLAPVVNPAIPALVAEEILKAYGIKDISKWLTPPQIETLMSAETGAGDNPAEASTEE